MSVASATMAGAAMASSIINDPQAGMATVKNMCASPGMSQMCQDNTHIVIGTCIGLIVLSTSAVLLRLASRRVSALSFWWDDAVIILSLMGSFACSALMLIDAKNGVGRHFETVPESSVVILFKTTVAYDIFYCVCVTLTKISILLFYYRLFGVNKNFKYACYVVLTLVTCWCIAIVLTVLFQCIPVEAAWIRPYPHSKCINSNASLLGTAITNVILDIVILVLPMVPIWSLSLTVRQKVTLTAIFLLGAFICGAAIVRVWAIINIDQTDVTWSYVRPLIWSSVEISIGITCACLPTLQPLIQLCLGRRSLSNPSRRNPNAPNNNNNNNNNQYPRYGSGLGYAVGIQAHGRPQMVGLRRPSNTEFYRLKERGGGITEIISSAWASREELGLGASEASASVSARAGTSWSDEIPLKGIRVKNEVEVDTSSDTGGVLSPV
ncbi:MAG: hypothetical protein ASARMPREDX12_003920 [Alectoria sarmentosa]|nr:MAG: hypothetical protein ASARMPREDX12_003920 [Alectoria sarmentosa]